MKTARTEAASAARKDGLPRLLTLQQVVEELGRQTISISTLRREIAAGRMKAVRSRPGHNAKLLVREDEVLRWLEQEAAARQYVARPTGSARARKEVRDGR